ncbi:DUF2934 domain-containing protein [Marinobacter nauticus]|uniref:Small acid-soluble spore P family protein n=1 Tax=Marinobacter nauticus (strain ATCC 700491 / DSM 11845 / VT8) TaxID=351348 RepID=A1U8C4_MARN8|nr:DUF2934 domain-containing protein [Marinobacter nauticus]ABM21243.1 small acid-soluble spore P family protein [Marinobacter nauticus VT8]MCP4065253.1 DUF2934 domain-containing protein [Gammaproteobacteria bacterium]
MATSNVQEKQGKNVKLPIEKTVPAESLSSKQSIEADHRRQMIEADHRRQMIEEAAYYIAEKRQFAGDCSMDDWLEAERTIDNKL